MLETMEAKRAAILTIQKLEKARKEADEAWLRFLRGELDLSKTSPTGISMGEGKYG